VTWSDRDSLLAWLADLPEVQRVQLCRVIADRSTQGAVTALADATVYAMTRPPGSWRSAMEALGVSESTVRDAVMRHLGTATRSYTLAKSESAHPK